MITLMLDIKFHVNVEKVQEIKKYWVLQSTGYVLFFWINSNKFLENVCQVNEIFAGMYQLLFQFKLFHVPKKNYIIISISSMKITF